MRSSGFKVYPSHRRSLDPIPARTLKNKVPPQQAPAELYQWQQEESATEAERAAERAAYQKMAVERQLRQKADRDKKDKALRQVQERYLADAAKWKGAKTNIRGEDILRNAAESADEEMRRAQASIERVTP